MMKARLKGAQKGHSLLKKKSDALTMRFRKILRKIIEVMFLKTSNCGSCLHLDYYDVGLKIVSDLLFRPKH